jgi:hypothetical protein
MLGSSWVAAQLAASQEGLSSVSEWGSLRCILSITNFNIIPGVELKDADRYNKLYYSFISTTSCKERIIHKCSGNYGFFNNKTADKKIIIFSMIEMLSSLLDVIHYWSLDQKFSIALHGITTSVALILSAICSFTSMIVRGSWHKF